jgi:filamentous hemagglutinin family protein
MSTRTSSTSAPIARLIQAAILGGAAWLGLTADPARADIDPTDWTEGVVIEHNGDIWTITAPDGSIINYTLFDILAGQTVQFLQGDAAFRVLNRVDSPDPSVIEGNLFADGIVYLINPSGLIFENGAIVDAAGLYAIAGNLTDENFLDGADEFVLTDNVVVNQGAFLHGADLLHLIGQRVANHGVLVSDGGIITMVAGNEVILQQIGERISVRVDGEEITDRDDPFSGGAPPSMLSQPGVENSGVIQNFGGQVVLGAGDMYSLAIRNTSTGSIEVGDGEIQLVASGGLIELDEFGLLSASVDDGDAGDIIVQAPSVLNRGFIRANSDDGDGGSIELAGANHMYMSDSSIVTARGGGNGDGGSVSARSLNGQVAFADGALIDVSGGDGGHGGEADFIGDSILFNGELRLDGGDLYIAGPGEITFRSFFAFDDFLEDEIVFFGSPPPSEGLLAAPLFSAIEGDITVQSMGWMLIDAMVEFSFDNNLTLLADDEITLIGAVTGLGDFTVRADNDNDGWGFVDLQADLSLSGDALFSGTHIFLRGSEILSNGTQTYNGAVEIGNDYLLAGSEVIFNGTVDSLHSWDVLGEPRGEEVDYGLEVIGDDLVYFGDDVGGNQNLAWLTVTAGDGETLDENLIVIAGNLIRADGDIIFNAEGEVDPALVATIAALGDLTIESLEGSFYMGLNEKMTSLGDLTISAANGSVTVGDLNCFGDLSVDASEISIWGRDAGLLFDADGNLIGDLGAEIIAGGSIFFSTSPTILGDGSVRFASATGDISSSLSEFDFTLLDELPLDDFTFGDRVLDLTIVEAAPPVPPLDPELVDDAMLATAFAEPTRVSDRVLLDPVARRALERLAIFLRSLNDEELAAATEGRQLYLDVRRGGLEQHGDEAMAINSHRLRRESVLNVVQQYASIFVVRSTAEENAQAAEQEQVDHIRTTLASAWSDYTSSGTTDEFHAYLAQSGEHVEALAYVDGLNRLFRELWTAGVNSRELRNCVNVVLRPITPDTMDQSSLEQAIGIDRIG